MSLQKLAILAKKFQTKLAQVAGDPWSGMKPEDVSSMPVEQLQEKMFPRAPGQSAPKPAPATKPHASSTLAFSIPSPIQQALDKVAPVLKGNLFLQVDGSNVNAKFNNVLAFDVNQIRALLTKALPGYTINVVGEQNPRWVANYV